MAWHEPAAPTLRTPSERRRSRILEVLREADAPLDVESLSARLRLHPNTVRGHLRMLVGAGLVSPGTRPVAHGRPRAVYAPAPGADRAGRIDDYRRLARMLASAIAAAPDASRQAVRIGERWGSHLTEGVPPFATLDAAETLARLERLLEALGFEPELDHGDPEYVRILMRRCPFREVATEFGSVVCPLHLGILRGALAELGRDSAEVELDPFVEPTLCVARVAAGANAERPPARTASLS